MIIISRRWGFPRRSFLFLGFWAFGKESELGFRVQEEEERGGEEESGIYDYFGANYEGDGRAGNGTTQPLIMRR